jgi:hypothetical protein
MRCPQTGIALAISAILLNGCSQSKPPVKQAAKAEASRPILVTLDKRILCATSRSNTTLVLAAYRTWDLQAMDGLVARGKAMWIERGTKLAVVRIDENVAAAGINSGFQIGESCWPLEGTLQPGTVNIK